MEEFRNKIRTKTIILTILGVISIVSLIVMNVVMKVDIGALNGAIEGFFCGVLGTLIVQIPRFTSALRSEEKLKEMYIREKDERGIKIKEKSGYVTVFISMFALSFAAMFASFFNTAVAIALAVAAFFIVLAFTAVSIYLNKKM